MPEHTWIRTDDQDQEPDIGEDYWVCVADQSVHKAWRWGDAWSRSEQGWLPGPFWVTPVSLTIINDPITHYMPWYPPDPPKPVVFGKDTYNHRLDTLTAIFVMGWHIISLASGEVAWSTPTQELVREWSPTSNNAHLGMLLGEVMDGNKAAYLNLQNHPVARNEWLATLCGPEERGGRETDDTSWQVALVKAIVVYCGGSLPEETEG